MTQERPRRISPSKLGEAFGFSEREELFRKVTAARFRALLDDERTTVHSVGEDANSYGEFLFVTLSRPAGERRIGVTFYGQGYHEYRERWITNEWAWYQALDAPERLEQVIAKREARERIEARRAAIAPYVTDEPPSPRARLFALLADMTDEDGAIAELDDLGDMAEWLFGDAESMEP